jgi:hypothetical protein
MTDVIKKAITKFQGASGLTAINGPYFGRAKDLSAFPFSVILIAGSRPPQFVYPKGGADYVIESTQLQFNIYHTDLPTLSGYQEALHTAFDKTTLPLDATGDTFISCLRTTSSLRESPWLSTSNDPVYLASTVYEISWTNAI